MRILAVLLLTASIASAGSQWYKVGTSGSEAIGLSIVSIAKVYTPDPAKNEYPVDYAFPQTNMMYWVKSGNDWVAMDAAQKAAKNAALKQKTTDDAVADVDMDTLFKAIALSISNNDKTYEAVKANFKANVDPLKAGKKDKGKK